MPINKNWHQKHRMPQNATPKQRLHWHLAHQKYCNCRELTKKMLAQLKEKAK